ncbi:MAG: 5'-3' exonuclease [Candidatus Binatia bacterium]
MVVWPMIEFEADDALATAAARWRDAEGVEQIVICSPDKDLAQCVSGTRVVCLDRRRRATLDESGVAERFGLAPESIPDWLALVGDSADGIPGIAGFGAKTASRLLARYRRLEKIPLEPSAWNVGVQNPGRLSAALRWQWEDALLYRRLATLRTDVPLAESLEDLRWRGARRYELESLCRDLGDEGFLERVAPFAA